MCSVTLTHETRSPTPPDKQKKVRFSICSRIRARECFHRSNSRSHSRRRVRVQVVLLEIPRIFVPFRLFFVFFFAVCLVCPSFSEFAVCRDDARRRRRESNEREREEEQEERRPEFGNKNGWFDARCARLEREEDDFWVASLASFSSFGFDYFFSEISADSPSSFAPGNTRSPYYFISLKTLSTSRKEISKNELFNRDVRIALYPFPLRVDRYRRRDWLWRRHDVDGSLGGGQETNRRCALRQGEVLGGVETSFRLLR